MDLFVKVYPSYLPIIFDLYKIILCAVSSLAIVSVVVSVVPFQAFGDGFTQENVYASVGIDNQSIFLPENGISHIQASVTSIINNGISDTSRNGVARGNLVIPSVANETIPEFSSATIPILISFVSLLVF